MPRRALTLLLLATSGTAVAIVGAAVGCGPGFLIRVPGASGDCKRTAVGPAVVAVFEFDANGGLKQRSDWTFDAARNVDAAVAARVERAGGRTFTVADVAHTDVACDDFRHWSSAALQEIAGKVAGTKSSPRQSVGDWRFPTSLATWRAALRSDFVLAVAFVDAYEAAAPARAASSTSTSSRYDAAQTGIACLVDLNDGRVIACGTSTRRFGDLRTANSARDAVADVVDRICP
jgi:hypothetical protein